MNNYDETQRKEQQEVIDLTRQLLRKLFCESDMDYFTAHLAEDVVWLGGGETHHAEGKEAVTAVFLAGSDEMIAFDMTNETYQYRKISPDGYFCLGECDMLSKPGQELYMAGHQRCTFVFRREAGELRVVHIHYSLPFGEVRDDELFAREYAKEQYDALQRELDEEKSKNRRNSELVYLALKDTAVCNFSVDFKHHRVEFPENTARRYGLRPEYHNELSTLVDTVIAPESQEAFAKFCEAYQSGAKFADCECRLKQDRGWARISLSRIPDEDSLAVGLIEDITLSKRNERSYTKTIQAFGEMYFAIYYCDCKSDRYKRMREFSPLAGVIPGEGRYSDWVTNYAAHYIPDERERKEFLEKFDLEHVRSRLSRENRVITVEYRRHTDASRWVRAAVILADMDDADPHHFVFALRDIEEEHEREKQTRLALESAFDAANRANQAKSDFLSRMSHDIRTPMNAIIGMTAIAASHLQDTERVEDCLRKITISSKHLLALINEVLDMSKIESGKIDLAEDAFELPEIVDDVMTIMRPVMESKRQTFDVRIGRVNHEKLMGDSMRLQQVFVNILSNASKYTPEEGHIVFSIREIPVNSPKLAGFEFVFEDNGIGMSEEFLPKLFEPFVREDDLDGMRKSQGTGLGMSIARNIVRMMNGDIEVESKKNVGSRFTVTVYLRVQETEEISPEEFADLPVLVADDDQDTCVNTCELLDSLGMKSQYVTNGIDAVACAVEAHAMQKDFFAVILDWKMPGMDGVETARAIRVQVGPDIPIIVLSAYDWSEIEMEAREAGVDLFIRKPLFRTRLQQLFHDLVQGTPHPGPQTQAEQHMYPGHRVLLVEDNDLNREIAQEFLQNMQITVDTAINGQEAVEKVAASAPGTYDLVFMDVQMPIMNGYAAATAIRHLNREDALTLPIVAMTANTFAEDVHKSFAAGMNGHIPKPLDMKLLIRILDQWL